MADPNPVLVVDTGQAVTQSVQQLVVVGVLICTYALVPVVAIVDFIVQLAASAGSGTAIIDIDTLLEFLSHLSAKEGSVLEALHKLILPLTALFIGSNFGTLKRSRLAGSLFLVPLIGTIASLGCAALIDAFSSTEVQGLTGLPGLFRDIASNLGIFLMLMIGQVLGKEAK